MAFDHAGFFTRVNRTNAVLFTRVMTRAAIVFGPVFIVVVLNVATRQIACAEAGLYLVGSNNTYTVNGSESFSGASNCSSQYFVSPVCVDGGATLQVVGTGATLVSQRQVFVGYKIAGTSTLSIQDGGSVLLNHTVIQAGWSGGDGLINVSGAGSRIVTSPDSILVVGTGDNGNAGSPFYNTGQTTYGGLSVTDGGHVQVGTVAVGLYGNGEGAVTVDGPDSLLHVVQDYYVNGGSGGDGGSGTTQISNGGRLVVDGQISFGGDGTDGTGSLILQSGGTLELGDKVENGQTASALLDQEGVGGQSNLVLSGGAIKLINSGLNTAMDMQLTGGVQSTLDTNGRTAVLSGTLAGDGGAGQGGAGHAYSLGG